jgi:hypothetical protein
MTIDEQITAWVDDPSEPVDAAMGNELRRRYQANGFDLSQLVVDASIIADSTALIDCIEERQVAISADISTPAQTNALAIEYGAPTE